MPGRFSSTGFDGESGRKKDNLPGQKRIIAVRTDNFEE
jgi:hypothetical protein